VNKSGLASAAVVGGKTAVITTKAQRTQNLLLIRT
jgi:hypothetical protein